MWVILDQMNDKPHLLDLSNVYGSDAKPPSKACGARLSAIRRGLGNRNFILRPVEGVTGKEPSAHVKCFKAGDGRSSVTPNLAVTHTVFLRQHNRLVALLADLNPHWNDERLYQEARRILAAQMQHITYNEWLPVVIGREKMQELFLLPLQKGFSRDYDENANPSILNEFAAAAFRFGHSLIQGQYYLYDLKRKKTGSVQLLHHFFKTQSLYTPGNLDKFLIGLATQPDQKVDNVFTEELTNHLFEKEGKSYGMDLLSLNIQRGRGHGLPGYNSYRANCGLPRSKDFDGLIDLIPRQTVNKLKYLYASVEDVDLYIAGVSERPAKGAVVGPTFQCIIADQFLRLKRGDRYFYDLGGQSGSFTEKQLEEIRKTSFARLVCDNSLVQLTQPLVFKSVSAVNPIVDCKSTNSISHVSLQAWKEFPGKKG
ncbi:peroxidase-like [Daphnia pulicaria]|uniref:peroxidase-like n=1 Tax=Daphnia pulicaria TaxID=35523 RepID=UPI001EEB541F|nr:peroxidase-like [Daphnia pulicaria]